jgi:hypothetical protein
MKKYLIIIISLLSILGVNNIYAQFVYENREYTPLIKTVQLEQTSGIMTQPVITLNGNKRLVLSFDELSEQTNRYEYTIIHCESDWTESKVEQNEYLEGFFTQRIENYQNSFNTIQRYVHYWQTIPSENMKIKKSGNYIIKVYKEDEPDKVVLTKRFYCVEDLSNIQVEVTPSKSSQYLKTKQEVSVKVGRKDNSFFSTPESLMKVYVQQNGREDNKHQLRMRGMYANMIDYSFDESNLFDGGNEFRSFDFTSIRTKSQFIKSFGFENNENQVYLRQEQVKNYTPYISQVDINGKYYVRNDISEDYSIGSDYAWVHFFLPQQMSLEGSYYIVGDLTNWRYDAQNRMTYQDDIKMYHVALYLKQGYYNYQILFKNSNSPYAESSQIEGNHSETNNKYTVYVYYRNFGDDFESLVGLTSVEYNPKR